MNEKPFADVTYKVIGAAMKVHNELGPGYKEEHYHRALSSALADAGLSFRDEFPLKVSVSGAQVGLLFIDHLVEESVVVEEKAFPHLLTNEEVAQVITYLAALKAPVGLLLNFGRERLEYKRVFPPRKFDNWENRVKRYAWTPRKRNPFIRSESVDELSADSEVAH
jgi:GxxExxY protein